MTKAPDQPRSLLRRVVDVVEPPLARRLNELIESPRYLSAVRQTLDAAYTAVGTVNRGRERLVHAVGLPSRDDQLRLLAGLNRLEGRAAELEARLHQIEGRTT